MITSSPARRRICSWVLLTSSAVSSVERTRAKSSPLYSTSTGLKRAFMPTMQ